MGLKLALIMLIVIGVMSSGFYWYYQDSQAKIAILHENNAKLETAINFDFSFIFFAIQNAVKLLPVPQGIIILPLSLFLK